MSWAFIAFTSEVCFSVVSEALMACMSFWVILTSLKGLISPRTNPYNKPWRPKRPSVKSTNNNATLKFGHDKTNFKHTLFLGSFRLNMMVLYLFMYLLSVLRKMSNISTSMLATSFTTSLSDVFKSPHSPTLQKWNGSSSSLEKSKVPTHARGRTLTAWPGCWRGTSGCSVWSGCWAEMVWTRERWEQAAPAGFWSRSPAPGLEKVSGPTLKAARGWTKPGEQEASSGWWTLSYGLWGRPFDDGWGRMWMVLLRLWPDRPVLCWGVSRGVGLQTRCCCLAASVFQGSDPAGSLLHRQAEKMEQREQQRPLQTGSEELQLQPPVLCPF